MCKPDNDRDDLEQNAAGENESTHETNPGAPGSYYYDDANGYEIYREDDSGEECPSAEPAADSLESRESEV